MKKSSHLVCSAHFEESYIKLIKHLKDDAIPTMKLPKHVQEGFIDSENPCTSAETLSTSAETPSTSAVTPSTSAESASASTETTSTSTETPTKCEETVPIFTKRISTLTKTVSTYTETDSTYTKQPSSAVRTKGNMSYVIIKEDSSRTEALPTTEQGEDKGKVNIKRYNVQTQTDALQTEEKKTQTIMSLTYKPPKRPRVWKVPQQSNIKNPKLGHKSHEIAKKD